MGVLLVLFWPLFVLAAPFEIAGFALSNILGPFGEAAEVWIDYYSGMISF